ncbi:nucleotidyltransferase family protein [Acetobacterium bakii]|uniref:MobA-like NTP transferase domain-containing protein n=1 Tax=Acetobacterium bakii TaxID=52689 RepID=A0A0L6U4Z6_9FIRM|nr:nucleotidyltransferase family protein [Acetobacterium bakii]KNZ43606.1 hypothetical protein AKG39_00135 [Acetobacterium bakii]
MLAGIVLAAGLSSRMGAEKMLLPFGEGTVLEAAISRIPNDVLDQLLVVTRQEIWDAVELPQITSFILNRSPEKGQAESLQLGIAYLRSNFSYCQGILIFLGDHPLTNPRLICDVVRILEENPKAIVLPEYHGIIGHPVAFGSKWFSYLENQNGDMGGRRLIVEYPEAVIRIPGDETCIMDMDSKADYRRILNYAEKYQ